MGIFRHWENPKTILDLEHTLKTCLNQWIGGMATGRFLNCDSLTMCLNQWFGGIIIDHWEIPTYFEQLPHWILVERASLGNTSYNSPGWFM
jgi:hypothetical protein